MVLGFNNFFFDANLFHHVLHFALRSILFRRVSLWMVPKILLSASTSLVLDLSAIGHDKTYSSLVNSFALAFEI